MISASAHAALAVRISMISPSPLDWKMRVLHANSEALFLMSAFRRERLSRP